jgi:hypothetical protein
MTQIHESITARVPFAQILALADHYLKWLPRNHDGAAEIVLHAHVANLEIERDALLTIAPARVSPGLQVFSISWRDREDGPLPVFRGTLCAEEEDERFCRLDLDGGYAPPGGLAGAAFDAVLGHTIALDVARELLATFKAAFEQRQAELAAARIKNDASP